MGPFKLSFNPNDQFGLCVTGPNVFKYYKIKDNQEFEADHTQMNHQETYISSKYLCHDWGKTDGRIIVGTDQGEILLLETTGEYKCKVEDSPMQDFEIACIENYSRGFIVGGTSG